MGEENQLDGLRHTTTDVDFGMEIESIDEIQEPAANSGENSGAGGDNGEKKTEKKGPDISFSSKGVDDDNNADNQDQIDNQGAGNQANSSDDDKTFNALLKTLGEKAKEKNILDFSPEEFDKAEDKDAYFDQKLQSTIESKVKESLEREVAAYKAENLPEEINELIDLHKKGVPLYGLLEADQTIASIEGITTKDIEEDTSLQKTLVSEALIAQGYSKEKIDAKIKRYEDLGVMKDESLEAKDILLNLEKERKKSYIQDQTNKKQAAVQQRDAKIAEITSTINTRDEIIPGFKLTPEDRKTLIEGITKLSHYDKQGKQINALQKARLDDPLHDLKLAYFTLVLKGDTSKIKIKTETAITKRLKDALGTQDRMGSNQGGNGSSSSSNGESKGFDKQTLRNALRQIR